MFNVSSLTKYLTEGIHQLKRIADALEEKNKLEKAKHANKSAV